MCKVREYGKGIEEDGSRNRRSHVAVLICTGQMLREGSSLPVVQMMTASKPSNQGFYRCLLVVFFGVAVTEVFDDLLFTGEAGSGGGDSDPFAEIREDLLVTLGFFSSSSPFDTFGFLVVLLVPGAVEIEGKGGTVSSSSVADCFVLTSSGPLFSSSSTKAPGIFRLMFSLVVLVNRRGLVLARVWVTGADTIVRLADGVVRRVVRVRVTGGGDVTVSALG